MTNDEKKNGKHAPKKASRISNCYPPLKGDAEEAFRLARLIALLMRVHPVKSVHPETMLQVKLADAGERSFALHIKWRIINLVDRPQAYGRLPDLIVSTNCLTGAELCVGITSVTNAVIAGTLVIERGEIGRIKRVFDAFYKLRPTDLVYPPHET